MPDHVSSTEGIDASSDSGNRLGPSRPSHEDAEREKQALFKRISQVASLRNEKSLSQSESHRLKPDDSSSLAVPSSAMTTPKVTPRAACETVGDFEVTVRRAFTEPRSDEIDGSPSDLQVTVVPPPPVMSMSHSVE